MRWLGCLLLIACDATQAQPPQPAPRPQAPSPQAVVQTPPLGPRAKVKLVVLGEFPEELIANISSSLESELQVEVDRLPARPLPREAYYPPRRRYRADRLLDHLRPLLDGEPEAVKVIGFTSVDISTTARGRRDWGIFGLGDLGGRASVISTFRLRRRARDQEHFHFRVVTTAIHEVGHTLGLRHCTEEHCVMNDAHGSITTVDTSTGRLGPECRAEMNRNAPQPVIE